MVADIRPFLEPASVTRMGTTRDKKLFPLPLDQAWSDVPDSTLGAVGGHGKDHLAGRLWASFESSPLEDGMEHPAKRVIAEALHSNSGQQALDWLRELCTMSSRPSFAASVLRCLGRVDGVATVSWRADLVRDCLAGDNAEIRDAAVQAAEEWGDPELCGVLESHSEEEPWLRQYIRNVIEDLPK